jgi:hypothetical protein
VSLSFPRKGEAIHSTRRYVLDWRNDDEPNVPGMLSVRYSIEINKLKRV